MTVRKSRVMIADDEKHIRLLLRAMVGQLECEVVGEAGDGQEAVAMYRSLKPDLLLLDVNMPRQTGDEALEEILGEFPEAAVIMLTSVFDRETVGRCLSLGAVNYIRKDTPLPEMKRLVRETLAGLATREEEHGG